VTATRLRWACGCDGPMHELGRCAQVADEDDGCPLRNHRRDALCARTPLAVLPPAGPEPDERGGPT
jgi:hypothetical protein